MAKSEPAMPPSQTRQESNRRQFKPEFKKAVVAECQQPDMSVSIVSIRYGINANLIQKWVKESEAGVVWSGAGGHRLRKYMARFKQSIVEQCGNPGVSASGIALQNGLSPKLVQAWVREARDKRTKFLPVQVDASEAEPALEESRPSGNLSVAVIEAPPQTSRQAVALPERNFVLPPTEAEPGQIEIELNGARIRLRGKADPATLRVLLGALR